MEFAPVKCQIRSSVVVAAMAGAGILVALTLWGKASSEQSGAPPVLDLVIGIASLALVPVMLIRGPVAPALLAALLTVLSSAALPVATLGTLVVARRCRFPVAVGVAAVGVLAQGVSGWWNPPGLPYLWWLLLVVLGEAALVGWGALARAHQALIDTLFERARRAEAEQATRVLEGRRAERLRIAREMHDVLAHRLSLVAASAGAIQYRPDASPERLARAAGVVRDAAHQALEELREVIGVLRDDMTPDSTENSLVPQPTLVDLERLVEESRRVGVDVSVEDLTSRAVLDVPESPGSAGEPARSSSAPTAVAGLPVQCAAATGRAAYRVVQEGLTNARKHAIGQPVTVVLRGSPGTHLELEVSNPMPSVMKTDAPFSPADLAGAWTELPGTGFGLVGLHERVQLAGGSLDTCVTGGNLFRLRASLPWPRDAR
ncbi:MAG: histidine kinase [Nakamurella sp.]